jgi:5-methylcytosine-specific restriction protein A
MPIRPPIHLPNAPRGGSAPKNQVHDLWRGSAASRGYDGAWKRFRAGFLRSNPLCADCFAAAVLTPASEVHHIRKLRDHPELRLVWSNAMGLCRPCHSTRTANGE